MIPASKYQLCLPGRRAKGDHRNGTRQLLLLLGAFLETLPSDSTAAYWLDRVTWSTLAARESGRPGV